MHLRRALLLFAIVLGLAALAASISRPPRETPDRASPPAGDRRPPSAEPQPPPLDVAAIRIRAGGRLDRRSLPLGRPVQVLVAVRRPGEVELRGLGLSAPAEPLTPASFQVLLERPQQVPVMFKPIGEAESTRVGLLRAAR